MKDSERYSDVAVRYHYDPERGVVHCGRNRCDSTIWLQVSTPNNLDRKWRYAGDVVIVSLEDGTRKRAFCSRKCAAQWLLSQAK